MEDGAPGKVSAITFIGIVVDRMGIALAVLIADGALIDVHSHAVEGPSHVARDRQAGLRLADDVDRVPEPRAARTMRIKARGLTGDAIF
jgi:hypothetical protein